MSIPNIAMGSLIKTSRTFPMESQPLAVEVNRAYIDLSQHLNQKTIGIFTTQKPSIDGEAWYLSGISKQQGFRQVYTFSDSNLVQNHNINFNSLTNFTRIWGTFFDGTFWNVLPYVDVVNANNQINIKISSTQIIVTKGGGAPPSISQGLIILEWISNV